MATKTVHGIEVCSPEPSPEERREARRDRERRIAEMAAEMDQAEEFDWQVYKIRDGDVNRAVRAMKDWAQDDMRHK